MSAPIADKIPVEIKKHGQTLIDNYAWMRDPKWPEVTDTKVIDYLKEENQYYDDFFKKYADQKEKIFEELKGKIKLSDQSTYVKQDDYFYYSRTEEDKDYLIYCRKHLSIDAPEEILLDVNKLAEGKQYTRLGSYSISPDHKLMAYSVDFNGSEKFAARIYDIEKKEFLPDEIKDTIDKIVWHENPETPGVFYTPLNDKWRTDKVFFHKLGTKQTEDKLILHEENALYRLSIAKSASRKFIFITVNGHSTNEVYVVNLNDPTITPKLFKPKKEDIYYSMEHNNDYFYILTNDGAKNFKICRVPIKDFQNSEYIDYIKEDEQEFLSSFDITNNYLILNYLDKALPIIKIQDLESKEVKKVDFLDPVFIASAYSTNFREDDIRVDYSSLSRPNTTYNYAFATQELKILKVKEIPSGFNPDEYAVERQWASNNGVMVPISIFYKKSLFKKDGSNPLYLYGYGSYGQNVTPNFKITAVSIADRGIIFAIAHIRGGEDLGREWHEAAKFLNKKRTFEDFIRVSEHLITEKYTSKGNIAIAGGSAGGMLIGAVINERPELFKAAIAQVPFVDVLNTMLDASLPLTPGEYKEWGNPEELEYFDYIKSYSPYDNVKAQKYPNLLVTAGVSDPRVGYWEPAKWVAKLRANKTDDNILIFKTNLDSGHRGASGRFSYLKEIAEELLFMYIMFDKI